MQNMFAATPPQEEETPRSEAKRAAREEEQRLKIPDYTVSRSTLFDHAAAFLVGFGAGFVVLFIFYKLIPLAVLGGLAMGAVNIFTAQQRAMQKRITSLRRQFFDLMEAMGVAMRAGNPVLKALESARKDLVLIYGESSDIIDELDLILSRFHNAMPLSEAFADLARRSGLEDIQSFADVFTVAKRSSGDLGSIMRHTAEVIRDKMQVREEIITLTASRQFEQKIMNMIPFFIVFYVESSSPGFFGQMYGTGLGRMLMSGCLVAYVISYVAAKRILEIEV